ncbi:MAG: DMT family transporter [Patescibacteria group bacterium]|nr:DMT family transporter [Patescibacteria group bacterium]
MKKGYLLVSLTALISGFSIYLSKFGLSVVNPYIFTTFKNVVVAFFLLSLILLFRKWSKIKALNRKQVFKLILVGLIGGSLPFLLFFKGLTLTSAVHGSFIHKTMFVWAGLLAVIFLKEKINKKLFFGIIFLLLGTALVMQINPSPLNLGDAMIGLAVLFWAGEQVLAKHLLKNISSLIVGWGRMFFGSLLLILFLWGRGEISYLTQINSSQLIWTLVTAGLLLFYVLSWYAGLKRLPVSTACCFLALGAPVTLLLSLIFEQKVISLEQIFGLSLIFLAFILIIDIRKIISSSKIKNVSKRIETSG